MENNYQAPQADLAYHNPDPSAFIREQEHIKILRFSNTSGLA
jgi:hypothetical protein